MNPKVLLVKCLNPDSRGIYAFKQIPLGIAYLAAMIKDSCNLDVFDMRVDDGLLEIVKTSQPDIIGLSLFSADFTYARHLIGELRRASPSSLLVAGGAHATVEPEETLGTGVDIVVRGEGEHALSAIVKALSDNTMDRSLIPSISYRDPAEPNMVRHNPTVTEENVDNFPIPAVEVFDLGKYDQYPLLTSRGCPHGCKFCASKTIWGQRVRFHSADRVFEEIVRAVEVYGYKRLVFIDDTFTLHHSRIFDLCDRIIRSGYGLTWSVNSRIDTINDEVAYKMSQAGCRVVSFGIETGSDVIQERVDKRISREQMEAAFDACRKAGIRVKTGWMVGLPGDYSEQMKSLDLMLELQPDEISIHHFIPIPGTDYWREPEKYGISFDKQALLENFSIDTLPRTAGLKFEYITEKEIESVIGTMVERLRQAGYKQPGEISSHDLGSKVVNTYMDRGRLSVLPSKG